MNRLMMIGLIGLGLHLGCGKGGSNVPEPTLEESLVAQIDDNRLSAAFQYDEQKRLSRIDYHYKTQTNLNTSLRFRYDGQTISAQYYNGAAPDVEKETYLFTLFNGKVVSVQVSLPSSIRVDYFYEYDQDDRMVEIGVRRQSGGQLTMRFDGFVNYNDASNTQELRLSGESHTSSDTVTVLREFDPSRSSLSLEHVGFDVFGSAYFGLNYAVANRVDFRLNIPFPFFQTNDVYRKDALVPTQHAIAHESGNGKRRDFSDIFDNGWKEVAWDLPEASFGYRYDEQNRLIGYGGTTISWQ